MTYLVYDDIYLKHDTGTHPETAERLVSIVAHLKKTKFWKQDHLLSPRLAEVKEISLVHPPEYIKTVEKISLQTAPLWRGGSGYLDSDTVVSPDSYQVARYAVGGVLNAIDAVINAGKNTNALCLVRPPGHHALPDQGMGFCLFNNVAIGARYLQKKYQVGKILIIDWDLHHGNGTQAVFYDDPTVFYFSMHRFPYYPGTGAAEETGLDQGEGFTLNIPLAPDITRNEYLKKFEAALLKIKQKFTPDFILISAGFDGYKNDPLGGLGLEAADFQTLTELVKKLADECCDGPAAIGASRIVSVLEGGYSLEGLPYCIEAHLNGLSAPGKD
ncbi:MAG: histone deacetylase [Planctomycetota bacterium]